MRIALLVAVAFLSAGCAAAPASTTGPASTPAAASRTLAYPEHGCSEAIALLLVDPGVAVKALPAGLLPADAQVALGTPVASGKAALFLNDVQCPDGGEAAQAILIQPPRVHNLTLPAATFDFFQPMYTLANVTLRTALASFGVPVEPQDAQLDLPARGVPYGTVGVRANGTPLHSFTFADDAAQDKDVLARFWAASSQGLAIIDYKIHAKVLAGAVATCSVGGPLAAQTGVKDCQGTQTVSLYVPDQSWDGTIRLLPRLAFA